MFFVFMFDYYVSKMWWQRVKFPIKEIFWINLAFHKKYNSLAFFKHEIGAKLLKRKYGHYKYEIPEVKKLKIYDKTFGKDVKYVKQKKSIKDHFNE